MCVCVSVLKEVTAANAVCFSMEACCVCVLRLYECCISSACCSGMSVPLSGAAIAAGSAAEVAFLFFVQLL